MSIACVMLMAETIGFNAKNVTYTTAGTFTETIPAGATTLDIEVWGPAGFGGHGNLTGATQGGGGGSGGYSHSQYNVAVSNGLTFTVVIAAAASVGSSSVVNGTFGTAVNMTGPAGGNGGIGTVSADGGGGVAGVTGTGGGISNSAGGAGNGGASRGQFGGFGSGGVIGVFGTGPKAGNGNFNGTTNTPGKDGQVLFHYV